MFHVMVLRSIKQVSYPHTRLAIFKRCAGF